MAPIPESSRLTEAYTRLSEDAASHWVDLMEIQTVSELTPLTKKIGRSACYVALTFLLTRVEQATSPEYVLDFMQQIAALYEGKSDDDGS